MTDNQAKALQILDTLPGKLSVLSSISERNREAYSDEIDMSAEDVLHNFAEVKRLSTSLSRKIKQANKLLRA